MSSVRPSARPSVCLSVTLVDQEHVGWKSWQLTALTIIPPTPSLFVPKGHPPIILPGEHGEILRRLEVGWGNWCVRAQKRQYLWNA